MEKQRKKQRNSKKEMKIVRTSLSDQPRSTDTYNSPLPSYANAMVDEMVRRIENERVRYGPNGEYL